MQKRVGLPMLAIALALTACDKPPAKVVGGNDGDIAAKVNGEVIGAAHVEALVKKQKFGSEQEAEAGKRRVLEDLVNQTLLAQEGREAGLEQREEVKLAIERAKLAVLAQAYLAEQLAKIAEPSADDVADYYKKHPELFVRRKLFHFNEYMIAASVAESDLRAVLQKGKDAKSVVRWLSEHKVPTQVKSDIKASEILLPPVVNRLTKLRPGEFDLVTVGKTYSVFALLGVQDLAPMSQEEAAPLIRARMIQARKMDASRNEVKRLREKAKLEIASRYAGEGVSEPPGALPESNEGQPEE